MTDRAEPGTRLGTGRGTRFPISDHCDGERFFNPHAPTGKGRRELARLWRDPAWKDAPWPERVEDPDFPHPAPPPPGTVSATFIGQASFLVQVGGLAILTDPVFSRHAGPFGRLGPRRARPPGIALDRLPPIDLILVSHGHYDHMDLPTLRTLTEGRGRSGPRVVSGLGNAAFLGRKGVGPVTELDWWQGTEGPGGLGITFVPAQHWSSRTPWDRNRTLWGGFLLEMGSARIYFAGDSGYCPHFREIGERFPGIDLALLPIGAYEPRWFMATQHMNPAEAVRAHGELGARASVAMHFGTFRLTPEAIDAPARALAVAREAAGLPPEAFRVPGFGETVSVEAG
jgi:L-ascorbate metabolism protein UlaG (beta-lactamase superfamily)